MGALKNAGDALGPAYNATIDGKKPEFPPDTRNLMIKRAQTLIPKKSSGGDRKKRAAEEETDEILPIDTPTVRHRHLYMLTMPQLHQVWDSGVAQ